MNRRCLWYENALADGKPSKTKILNREKWCTNDDLLEYEIRFLGAYACRRCPEWILDT